MLCLVRRDLQLHEVGQRSSAPVTDMCTCACVLTLVEGLTRVSRTSTPVDTQHNQTTLLVMHVLKPFSLILRLMWLKGISEGKLLRCKCGQSHNWRNLHTSVPVYLNAVDNWATRHRENNLFKGQTQTLYAVKPERISHTFSCEFSNVAV